MPLFDPATLVLDTRTKCKCHSTWVGEKARPHLRADYAFNVEDWHDLASFPGSYIREGEIIPEHLQHYICDEVPPDPETGLLQALKRQAFRTENGPVITATTKTGTTYTFWWSSSEWYSGVAVRRKSSDGIESGLLRSLKPITGGLEVAILKGQTWETTPIVQVSSKARKAKGASNEQPVHPANS